MNPKRLLNISAVLSMTMLITAAFLFFPHTVSSAQSIPVAGVVCPDVTSQEDMRICASNNSGNSKVPMSRVDQYADQQLSAAKRSFTVPISRIDQYADQQSLTAKRSFTAPKSRIDQYADQQKALTASGRSPGWFWAIEENSSNEP